MKIALSQSQTEPSFITRQGQKIPDVVTILKAVTPTPGLLNWYYEQGRAGKDPDAIIEHEKQIEIVTQFLCHCYLREDEPDLSAWQPEIVQTALTYHRNFVSFWGKAGLELISAGRHLGSENYEYSGIINCIARKKSAVYLINIKTRKPVEYSYWIESAAKRVLWDNAFPSTNNPEHINKEAIIRLSKEPGKWKIEIRDKTDREWAIFKSGLFLYDLIENKGN